jgi:hypothetical protein
MSDGRGSTVWVESSLPLPKEREPGIHSSGEMNNEMLDHWSHKVPSAAQRSSEATDLEKIGRSKSLGAPAHGHGVFDGWNDGLDVQNVRLPPLEAVCKVDGIEQQHTLGLMRMSPRRRVETVSSSSIAKVRFNREGYDGFTPLVEHGSFAINEKASVQGTLDQVIHDLGRLDDDHAYNNNGFGRSSFDALLSHGASRADSRRRRSEESGQSKVPSRAPEMMSGALSLDGAMTVADALKMRSSHGGQNGSTNFCKLDSTGFTVSVEPNVGRRKVRTGTSEGAHASQLVDDHQHQTLKSPNENKPISPPLSIIDANLHDTFGAHDWVAAGPSVKGRNFIVSKVPELSPIRSQLSSPIGSPLSSPNKLNPSHHQPRVTKSVYTNLSSHLNHDYLERRKQARMDAEIDASNSSAGYIAEAKKVLDEAMNFVSSENDIPDNISFSHSGALDPLMKHLKSVAGDDVKCRSALRTLALLEANLPNRAIVSDLQGRRILMNVVSMCSASDVKENAVQLLWDLDEHAGADAAALLKENDLICLGDVLCATESCEIASHALHFLKAAIDQPPESRPLISCSTLQDLAAKLTSETCAHKHHLGDAAQYCLGETLGALLSGVCVADASVKECQERILGSLLSCKDPAQCQLLLTVMSSLVGRSRPRKIFVDIGAVGKIMIFSGQNMDPRLQARAFSLLKALSSNTFSKAASKQGGSWYFDTNDHLD